MSASSALSLASASSASDSLYDSLSYLLAHPSKPSSRKQSSRSRTTAEIIESSHRQLRLGILTDGIPAEGGVQGAGGRPPLRPTIWKIFLDVAEVSAAKYLTLVAQDQSVVHDKISNDAFRTLATDRDFRDKVSEKALIRLLNAFAWSHDSFAYVQGMNVLAAPFLYVFPSELEAYFAFDKFITECCPTYVTPNLTGVHRGLHLLDRCLHILDPELFDFLRSKNLQAELYAFQSVMTLCAGTPPLDEVIQLWDFLLAYGVHLNILCVIAQVLKMKEEIMESPSPMKLLGPNFPPLESRRIIAMTVLLVRDLPEALYAELVRHPREC